MNKLKRLVVPVIPVIILWSCTGKEKPDNSELNRIQIQLDQLKAENNQISRKLDSVTTNYINPFYAYQRILLREPDTNPDTILRNYDMLIKKYPDTFWAHEAKKRQANVKERIRFWNGKNWAFPKLNRPPERLRTTISCPGC